MKREIKYIAHAVRFFDIYGNTYHSVRIHNIETEETLKSNPMIYGYGDQYRYTAFELMVKNNWVNGYDKNEVNKFEQDSNYSIIWNVTDGRKKDMLSNVR